MKVLIPTADYPPIEGGIATVALQTARTLAALGHEVTVVAPRFPDQEGFDAAEPYRVVRFRGYGLGWLRAAPMLLAALPWLRRADLVLAINIASGGVTGRLGRALFGTPYVAFAYAYEFLKFRGSPAGALLRALYRRSCAVVAISAFTRENLAEFGVPRDGITVIPPGAPEAAAVSEEALRKARHDFCLDSRPVLLAVGRFVPRKNHTLIVEAMPRVLERYPGALLVMVGRGPCLPRAVRTAGALGVRNSVIVPGNVPDDTLAALYEACDLFVLPTGTGAGGQVEGFGLVFAEAAAHGKPVVAGRSGGVVDAVLDGETGIIVEPGDPAQLAAAVLSLLDNPARAAAMGAAGRARVEGELNWRRFTERLLALTEDRS